MNAADGFELMVYLKHFYPTEVHVKILGQLIVVHAKHDDHVDEHGFVSREFTGRYKLPDGVSGSQIEAFVSQDGVLIIRDHNVKDNLVVVSSEGEEDGTKEIEQSEDGTRNESSKETVGENKNVEAKLEDSEAKPILVIVSSEGEEDGAKEIKSENVARNESLKETVEENKNAEGKLEDSEAKPKDSMQDQDKNTPTEGTKKPERTRERTISDKARNIEDLNEIKKRTRTGSENLGTKEK